MDALEAAILIFFALALLLLVYVWLLEPRWLEVTRTSLRDKTVLEGRLRAWEGPLPGRRTEKSVELKPESELSADRLDVLFFSDVHAGFNRIKAERIRELVQQEQPDVVLFGGDLVNGDWDSRAGLRWIAEVSDVCRTGHIPLLGVRGNHDRGLSQDRLDRTGLHLLENDSVTVTGKDGSAWQITGLEDLRTGRPDFAKAVRYADRHAPSHRIVLAHNPDTILTPPADSQALVLSGHFHGGQIRLPFRLEYRTLRREQLCHHGFYDGLYRWGSSFLYITRGIGCVLFPFRMGARPEVTLLRIESTDVRTG